jgi:hypothetical protein
MQRHVQARAAPPPANVEVPRHRHRNRNVLLILSALWFAFAVAGRIEAQIVSEPLLFHTQTQLMAGLSLVVAAATFTGAMTRRSDWILFAAVLTVAVPVETVSAIIDIHSQYVACDDLHSNAVALDDARDCFSNGPVTTADAVGGCAEGFTTSTLYNDVCPGVRWNDGWRTVHMLVVATETGGALLFSLVLFGLHIYVLPSTLQWLRDEERIREAVWRAVAEHDQAIHDLFVEIVRRRADVLTGGALDHKSD